jgi:hypothetical protein
MFFDLVNGKAHIKNCFLNDLADILKLILIYLSMFRHLRTVSRVQTRSISGHKKKINDDDDVLYFLIILPQIPFWSGFVTKSILEFMYRGKD